MIFRPCIKGSDPVFQYVNSTFQLFAIMGKPLLQSPKLIVHGRNQDSQLMVLVSQLPYRLLELLRLGPEHGHVSFIGLCQFDIFRNCSLQILA